MAAILTVPWRKVKYVWMLMTLQKKNFYREVTPMTRVYTQVEMVLFSFSITVGKTFFYRIPLNILKHGDLLMLFWVFYTPVLFITAGCFAEMAAMMPAVGAHYHYCYSTICEIVAFIVGWHLIFAYTALSMNGCKILSEFIDLNLLDGWISTNLKFMEKKLFSVFRIPGYVDILCPMLAVTMAFQAAWAVKFTKSIVNLFTSVTIVVMIVLIISFTAKMDFTNLSIGNTPDSEKLYDALYAVHRSLIGYETLSVLGEEAQDPTRTIPLSIMITVKILMIVYLIYTCTMSSCLKEHYVDFIDKYNPLGSIVLMLDLPWLYWVSFVGAACSLWCSAYGTMFIAIRLLYAMSRDGMIFKQFSKIDRYTRKPAIPAIIFGVFIGLVATFIHVKARIGFFSLIFAKVMSTLCLLITRYRCEKVPLASDNNDGIPNDNEEAKSWVLLNYPNGKTQPTKTTHKISMMLIYDTAILALCSIYCIVILYLKKHPKHQLIFKLAGFFSIFFFFIFSFLLRLQPRNDRTNLAFITPYVPAYPLLAIVVDCLSCLILCYQTIIYGFMWTGLGVLFYFVYSIRHSQESRNLYPDGSRWNPLELQPSSNAIDQVSSWMTKNL